MKILILAFVAIFLLQVTAGAEKNRRYYRHHGSRSAHHHSYNQRFYFHKDTKTANSHHPGKMQSDDKRSSAYKGDNVPENDGARKNKQRNLNYNSGQALPANNGR